MDSAPVEPRTQTNHSRASGSLANSSLIGSGGPGCPVSAPLPDTAAWRGGALPAQESLRFARQEAARCQQGGPALLGGRRTSRHSAHACVPALRYPESKTCCVNRTEGLDNMEPRGPLQMWGGGRSWSESPLLIQLPCCFVFSFSSGPGVVAFLLPSPLGWEGLRLWSV